MRSSSAAPYTRGPPMSGTRPAGPPRVSSTSRAATSSASTGWTRKPAGSGTTGSFASIWATVSIRSWNCVARRMVHGRRESSTRGSSRRRPYQVPGLVLITLGAAREVHDRPDPVHRRFDPLTGGQITGHVLDAVLCLTAAPAEHPYLATGLPQEPDDESSERTCAAR